MNRFVILYGIATIIILVMAILSFAGCDWILMTKKHRDKYDMPGLCKYFGIVCTVAAVGYAILAAVNFNAPRWFETGPVMQRGRGVSTLLMILIAIAALYSEKYRTVPMTEQEKKNRVRRGVIAGLLCVLILTAIFILFM